MHKKVIFTFCILSMILLQQCGIGSSVEKAVDQATGVIDNGIKDITTESASWSTVLQRVAKDLPEEISSTIRNDAQNLASRSIATAGTEMRCNVDFLAARAIASLQWLKARLKNETAVPPPPSFCQVVPDAVDLNVTNASSLNKITINGYDLDHTDPAGKRIQFYLLKANGEKELIPENRIGRTTHYQVTISLSDLAKTMYEKNIAKIVSTWNNQTASYPEVVVIPWQKRERQERVSLGVTSFMPPKIGRGDADFDTDDDDYMSIEARGELTQPNATTLNCRVYLHAREERSDWTEVGGYSNWTTAYTAPTGWKIVSFRPNSNSIHAANITTHGGIFYNRPAGEVVNRFQVFGDRDGDEAGTWTHVEVTWRPIEITIQQTIPDWAR